MYEALALAAQGKVHCHVIERPLEEINRCASGNTSNPIVLLTLQPASSRICTRAGSLDAQSLLSEDSSHSVYYLCVVATRPNKHPAPTRGCYIAPLLATSDSFGDRLVLSAHYVKQSASVCVMFSPELEEREPYFVTHRIDRRSSGAISLLWRLRRVRPEEDRPISPHRVAFFSFLD